MDAKREVPRSLSEEEHVSIIEVWCSKVREMISRSTLEISKDTKLFFRVLTEGERIALLVISQCPEFLETPVYKKLKEMLEHLHSYYRLSLQVTWWKDKEEYEEDEK